MGKKSSSSDDYIDKLVEQYEAAKTERRPFYLDGDQFADIACKYSEEKNFEKAQEVISYGLSLHPENMDLLIEQAYLYVDTMRLDLAQKVADCIYEDYNPEVKLLKAEILLVQEKTEEARRILETIEDKEDLETIIDIVYLYLDLGYPDEAGIWIDRGIRLYRNKESFMSLVAEYLLETQQYEKACEWYNALIDKDPYNPLYWVELAKSCFMREDISQAIEACDYALVADEKCGKAYLQRAHCYLYLENFEKAVEDYQNAIKYDGVSLEMGYWFIGMSYKDAGHWKEAETFFSLIIDACAKEENMDSPYLADVYNGMATILLNREDFEKAHRMCDKALEIFSDDMGVKITKGKIYLREGEGQRALDMFMEVLKCRWDDVEVWYEVGQAYEEEGEISQAKLFYLHTYELDSEYENVAGKLAAISLLEGDMDGFSMYNKKAAFPINEQVLLDLLTDENLAYGNAEQALKKMLKKSKREKHK